MCFFKNKTKKTLWVHEQVNSGSQEVRPQVLKDFFKPHNCAIQAFSLFGIADCLTVWKLEGNKVQARWGSEQ